MVDLRGWRVPVAGVLLGATVVRLAASVVGIVAALSGGASLPRALAGGSIGTADVLLAVGLAAVCWWCASDGLRPARGLAMAGFVVVTLQVGLSLAATVAGYVLSPGPALFGLVVLLVQLCWLVIPAIAAAVLWQLARPAAAADLAAPDVRALEGDAGEPAEAPVPEQPVYHQPAGWEPDEAAGAAWSSAGEAARGGSAAGWGSASAAGWEAAEWSRAAGSPGPVGSGGVGDAPDRPSGAEAAGPEDR
jgi:hypothetical protein